MMPVAGGEPIPICGLAICRYDHTAGPVLRFSCNAEWETENDSQWPSIEGALQGESAQYDISSISWKTL